jgi:hypothetical protein
MSFNLEDDKIFAYTIASVKDIGDVIKELMIQENYHLALDFLQEEKNALKEALGVLIRIKDQKYQTTFNDMIPKKLKDIEFAIKYCNNQLIDGKYKLLNQDQEYKYNRKKKELKIKNLKKLKIIAMNTSQWEFSDYIEEQIKKEEIKLYQA